ncbi:MAG: alcohol dehydrogenase catalytic domain-containing protein [Pyrinomonadaceae bacterium]|nr:alcohol dehydrogenase catalytic domain-containing protein [Pyrinomonadaceae bacterium]
MSAATTMPESVSPGVAPMKACVLVDVGRLEVREVPRPQVSSRDVLVRVAAVGICGTDTHIFSGHANYNTDERGQSIPLTVEPQILGHEINGYVAEKGSDVRDLEIGDHVVIDQGLNCISMARTPVCEYCQSGDSHQCEFYREHGITGLPGGLAEFLAVPSVNTVPIRSGLDAAEAALVEPLGCIIHSSDAAQQAHTRYATNADSPERRVRTVLICGAGPAGLLFTQYLRRELGYDGQLLVSAPSEWKRKFAKDFGADDVLDSNNPDLANVISEKTGGRGVEYLIEASGSGRVIASMPGLIRKQATVLLYGHGHAGVDLSVLNNVMFREPTLVTPVGASGGFQSDGRPSVYARALRLIEEHKIDVAPIITHRYKSLDAVQGALENDMRLPNYLKGVVTL